LGAEVSGVDLQEPLPAQMASRLRRSLSEHGLLVCRGQQLRYSGVLNAAALFGVPVKPSGQPAAVSLYKVQDRDPTLRGADFWHSDNSYNPTPGGPTALYALKVPRDARGEPLGDTLFSDAVAAAADLPGDLRRQIQGLEATHNVAHNGGSPLPEYVSGECEVPPDAVHPVLRRNPLSGEESFFVAPAYVRNIVGLQQDQSDGLLTQLFEHLLQPKYRFTHRWAEGDFIVWDNGRLIHKATTVKMPAGAERVMLRVQTSGTMLDTVSP